MAQFMAGAACADISPVTSQFLAGYPHVPRWSTGTHDPLLSSAVYMDNGAKKIIMIGNDNLYVPKDLVARARARIEAATGIPAGDILISATHTHSAPLTYKRGPGSYDTITPDCDDAYVQLMEDGIVKAATDAVAAARPAEFGLAVARVSGIGTNRRSPDGPADPEVPVLAFRDPATKEIFAIVEAYAMHPTVLHEDSKLCSADFPGAARQYLRDVLGKDIPVAHFMGASGNQSPRYCVKGQTFEEATRLGTILGKAVEKALGEIEFIPTADITVIHDFIEYPVRTFPAVKDAEAKVQFVREKFARQQKDGTPRAVVRTTECDLFGAEATYALSVAQSQGGIDVAVKECMPAEIMIIRIGKWTFCCWQGEVFIEFALAIRNANPDTYVFTCSNGTMAGYLTTEQAAEEGGYEASTSCFLPKGGDLLVAKTQEMLNGLR